MAISLLNRGPAWPATPIAKPVASADVAKNVKAARDFETLLLSPLLDSLQKTFGGDPDADIPGASDYQHMATEALTQAIAARGGIGIAGLILRHLQAPKVAGGDATGV